VAPNCGYVFKEEPARGEYFYEESINFKQHRSVTGCRNPFLANPLVRPRQGGDLGPPYGRKTLARRAADDYVAGAFHDSIGLQETRDLGVRSKSAEIRSYRGKAVPVPLEISVVGVNRLLIPIHR
jgi:hypothetical protein